MDKLTDFFFNKIFIHGKIFFRYTNIKFLHILKRLLVQCTYVLGNVLVNSLRAILVLFLPCFFFTYFYAIILLIILFSGGVLTMGSLVLHGEERVK